MPAINLERLSVQDRCLFFFTHPDHWPTYPFLPLVRRCPDGEQDLGVLVDLKGLANLCGFSSAVFLTNLFTLPASGLKNPLSGGTMIAFPCSLAGSCRAVFRRLLSGRAPPRTSVPVRFLAGRDGLRIRCATALGAVEFPRSVPRSWAT